MRVNLLGLGITGIATLAANGQQKPQQLPETVVEAKRYKDIVPGETNTATKSDTPIIELPQSVSSVNRAEIEQRGAQSAAEAVLHVPPWLRRGIRRGRRRPLHRLPLRCQCRRVPHPIRHAHRRGDPLRSRQARLLPPRRERFAHRQQPRR